MNPFIDNILTDSCQRRVNYLRISVTDRCNLRCRYCAPLIPKQIRKNELLTFEEMYRVVETAVACGITKVRLTGGEPLCRRGVIDFIRRLRDLPELTDISMTSNGTMVAAHAARLKEAGLNRINISLDTLDRDKFRWLTGADRFSEVWEGIEAASESGFDPVKINTVVMKGFNDDEIEQMAGLAVRFPFHVRFIEYMPIGIDPSDARSSFLPVSEVEAKIRRLGKLTPVSGPAASGPAVQYRIGEGKGEVGLIGSMSSHFCSSCNRLRLTATGYLRPCLLSDDQVNVIKPIRRGITDSEIKALILETLSKKGKEHLLSFTGGPSLQSCMGSIGG